MKKRFLKKLTVDEVKEISIKIDRLFATLINANEEKIEKLIVNLNFIEDLEYLHALLNELEEN